MSSDVHFGGCEHIVYWGHQGEHFAALRGQPAMKKLGVAVSQMRHLPVAMYLGTPFDTNIAAIIPHNAEHLNAIYTYCSSAEYREEIRRIDKARKVTNATLVKVPFEFGKWAELAKERFPDGLPEPYSDNPTQWLFHGHPLHTEMGMHLHVALVRLAGYRWPAEIEPEIHLAAKARTLIAQIADLPDGNADGLLCVPPVAGDRPLADRLRAYLAAVFESDWSDATDRRLLNEADERFDKKASKDASLEAWLRDRAFRQHCVLFHQRPFLWHVWDGQKDGFAAVVNYHRLTHANLEKLTFSLLGDWIARVKADDDRRRVEAASILQQRLQAILEGEKPYDIFVRWKPLAKQSLGWGPDLDDGIRVNVRPFVEADVLREVPNVKWTRDGGTDVESAPWYGAFQGERVNDHHTTLAEKRKARGLK